MKRIRAANITFRICMFAAMLSLFGCSTKHMILTDTQPDFHAKQDMALLVVVRTTSSIGGGQVFDTYLDGKMVGQTNGKGFFTADIIPGSHYVMAHAQNWVTARINFEPGRVYFLNQWVIYSFPTARTGFAAMVAENALKHIRERGSDHLAYDKNNPGPDMQANVFEELKNNFEKEVSEDPNRHKDTLEYKGYSSL